MTTEKEKPSYYAIIPADVRYCKGLTPNAKLLYGEITCLCSKTKKCWASNRHFAELYEVKERQVIRWITSLKENGFIKCEIKEGYKRTITLVLDKE